MTSGTPERVIDYLDTPPKRWSLNWQRGTGGHAMEQDASGEWVKHEDMDLYMFEGGQLMMRAVNEHDALAHRVEQLEAAIRSHVEDLARVAQIFRDHGMKASADETDTAVAELRAALSGVSP